MEPDPGGKHGEASRVAQSAVQERYRRDRVGVSHDRSADARGILAIDPGILAEEHRFVQDDVRGSEQVRRGPGPDVAGDGNPRKGVRRRQYASSTRERSRESGPERAASERGWASGAGREAARYGPRVNGESSRARWPNRCVA